LFREYRLAILLWTVRDVPEQPNYRPSPTQAIMASIIRKRMTKIKEGAKAKTKPSGWILPKEAGSFADEGKWFVFTTRCAALTDQD